MKAYVITEAEMNSLRDALELTFLRHCEYHQINPSLHGKKDDHSLELWRSFNFAYCRWRDAMGDDRPRNLSIDTLVSSHGNALMAVRPIIEQLIAAEYNVETWGLKERLAAIDAALGVCTKQGSGAE